MNKISIHCQSIPGWIPQYLDRGGVSWLKIVDPPEQDPFPGVRIIARGFMPDAEANELVWQGRDGAQAWYNRWRPWMMARPYVHAFEGPNEPHPMANNYFRTALNEFTVALAALMHADGLKLVGMNWSVGWPFEEHAKELGDGVQHCDYLGLHEYSAPAMWDNESWLCLRYRRTIAELEAAGYQVPPVLVTECGIDGGVLGAEEAKKGWAEYTDIAGYVNQLAWYNDRLNENDYVKAAFVFTTCDWDWYSFNVTEPLAMEMAKRLASAEPPPPPPPPPPEEPGGEMIEGIDVSEWQGEIDWQAVAASGVKFAIIRASVGRSDGTIARDARFEQNWEGAGAAGVLRGAYHYVSDKTLGQARYFCDTVAGRVPEIGLWADFEEAGMSPTRPGLFLEAADRNFGQTVGVYTRASFVNPWWPYTWGEGRRWWVASWDVAAPVLPMGVTRWTFWQYTSKGSVPGISGNVDLDRYNGSLTDLYAEFGIEPPEPPEPPEEQTFKQAVLARLDRIIELLERIEAKA